MLAVATGQGLIEYVIWKLFRLPPLTKRQRVLMFGGWAAAYTAWHVYEHGWEQVLDFGALRDALVVLGVLALIVWAFAYAPHGEVRKPTNM
jgi:hypothetical protein